jgi:hypothetical protein
VRGEFLASGGRQPPVYLLLSDSSILGFHRGLTKDEARALARELERDASAGRRVDVEKKLRALQNSLEENKAKGQERLRKIQDGQLVTLYRDLHEAARRHAEARGLEIVLHFKEPPPPEANWSPMSIARKKADDPCCKPMWAKEGIDVSEEVLAILNAKAPRVPKTPPGALTGHP